jgi:Flp pilus assembly protein TadD
MKKILFVFFVFCFVIPVRSLLAQSTTDTVEIAKHLRDERKFKDAFALLEKYRVNHPNDLNASWLDAQTACWMKHFKTSESIYENTIRLHPDNYYLKLDYAKMLVNIGEFEKAIPLLNNYLQYDLANAEALLALAKISYWKSNYKEAINEVGKILIKDPKNKQALSLQEEIISAESPWGKISIAHSSDVQPLKNTTPVFEGGLYKGALSFMHFNFQIPTFVTDNNTTNALWIRAGNKSVLSKQNMNINIEFGLLKYPCSKNVTFTENLQLDKTIINHLIFSIQAERKPYFYTVSSINNVVTDNHYSVSAAWSDPDKWSGKTAFDLDHFNDKNTISTFSAWVITPPYKVSIFEFHIGYGCNFSTSKENRFVAEKTLSEILVDFYYNPDIAGIYNPYFTPNNQQTHSALASISIHPLKILDIGTHAAYGFYAVAHNPYLYLDKDTNGNTIIIKNYFKRIYSPMEFSVYVALQITKKISFKTEYLYSITNFYKSNYLGFGLKMSFGHDKK